MAEMERFELSQAYQAPTAFRERTLQPLGYISLYILQQTPKIRRELLERTEMILMSMETEK